MKSAPELTCLLSEPDSLLFKGYRELLLLSSEAHAERIAEEGLPGLYVDPVLQKNRKQYIDLILKMHDKGLLHWRSSVEEQVMLFFATKKNGSLRLIADARRTNSRFRKPLPIQLPSAEGATRIVAPDDGQAFFGAGLDLKDYFHTLKIDEDLSSFFGLMPIRGRELPTELRLALGLSLDSVKHP